MNNNNIKQRYDFDNFKFDVTMAIKFQIMLYNFEVFKKLNIIKMYLFRLLEIYLVIKLLYLIILTQNEYNYKNNKQIIMSLYIKKTITSINTLKNQDIFTVII